jgi:hypothetical protein
MAKAKKKKESQAEQSERFRRAAEEVGADKDGKVFERAFRKIARKKQRSCK